MGYQEDKQIHDPHYVAAQLLVVHDAQGEVKFELNPEVERLLCTKVAPKELTMPADLLPFDQFDAVKLETLGIFIKPEATPHGEQRVAIIKEPVLSAMREVALAMREVLKIGPATALAGVMAPISPDEEARKVVSFAEARKRIEERRQANDDPANRTR